MVEAAATSFEVAASVAPLPIRSSAGARARHPDPGAHRRGAADTDGNRVYAPNPYA